ncbi:MAG TPA: lipase maturation factor family protein, partial [Kofleriaceae bacterium]|nr:lipase maturation factor family protein [Kofleriaceae bacterium]
VVLGVVGLVKKLDWQQMIIGCFAGLVIVKSWAVVDNLTSKHQAMNRSYDAWALVNTYGAFGSVGDKRYEIVFEGTLSDGPKTGEWREYDLPCKPGRIDRRPCVLGPYHRRLDWLIWFSAMYEQPHDPWLIHLAWKLLDGDRTVRELLIDPFHGTPPKWVRIRRYLYHLQPYSAPTWWTRELVDGEWLQPINKDTPGLKETLARYGWPSPSVH